MKILLTNARVIDGLGGLAERGWILIDGANIERVGLDAILPEELTTPSRELDTRDLSGMTVLPGFIDCHVHLAMDGSPDPMKALETKPDPQLILEMTRNAHNTLESGFTTVRDMGARNFLDVHLRNGIHDGLVKGPTIFCSGQVICITGGQGWEIGYQVDGADDARRASRTQIREGADWIKLMATGGVLTRGGRPGMPQLTLEELEAGVEEAHKASLKTAAHAQGPEGARNAVLAGIDSIEHGVALEDVTIEEMLKQDVFLVPTLSAPANILAKGEAANIPHEFIVKTERLRDKHIESLLKARDAGVKIAMGTDAGTPFNYHGRNATEMVYMVEIGFSAMETIQCATSRAAELLGMQDRLGSISPQKQADLIILKGNPLEDMTVLQDKKNIISVFRNGEDFFHPKTSLNN